jgi:RNA polymerase sigma factor (sigma-70 family)
VAETSWASLQQLLVERYHELRERLARRVGSADLASEALHEVYLRLGRVKEPAPVASPISYLLRAAYNVANDHRRKEKRHNRGAVVDAAFDIADDRPGPDGIAEAKIELAVLARALLALPERQRAILIASRYEQIPRHEIARRYNISRRLVQRELQRALEACKNYLDEND